MAEQIDESLGLIWLNSACGLYLRWPRRSVMPNSSSLFALLPFLTLAQRRLAHAEVGVREQNHPSSMNWLTSRWFGWSTYHEALQPPSTLPLSLDQTGTSQPAVARQSVTATNASFTQSTETLAMLAPIVQWAVASSFNQSGPGLSDTLSGPTVMPSRRRTSGSSLYPALMGILTLSGDTGMAIAHRPDTRSAPVPLSVRSEEVVMGSSGRSNPTNSDLANKSVRPGQNATKKVGPVRAVSILQRMLPALGFGSESSRLGASVQQRLADSDQPAAQAVTNDAQREHWLSPDRSGAILRPTERYIDAKRRDAERRTETTASRPLIWPNGGRLGQAGEQQGLQAIQNQAITQAFPGSAYTGLPVSNTAQPYARRTVHEMTLLTDAIEQLIERTVTTEIQRQQTAQAYRPEQRQGASNQAEEGVGMANDEIARQLLRRMRTLAQEERFRLGLLR
ncbi:hypothetical protein KFU94_56650 [Chloroflexi bacterium TSY]|nr:hypothetical protein [Chloroflexi bacterium TSY]